MSSSMSIYPEAELQGILSQVHTHCAADTRGDVASYIPEFSLADPGDFGLALATVSGQIFTVGEAGTPFTIQSVSKAFTYCLANELLGPDEVMRHVGVEPSGDAFNSIEFDPTTARPFNPMVNAGAITVAGLLYRELGQGAFAFILDRLSRAAGRSLDMDEAVYRSSRTPATAIAPSRTCSKVPVYSPARSTTWWICISASAPSA